MVWCTPRAFSRADHTTCPPERTDSLSFSDAMHGFSLFHIIDEDGLSTRAAFYPQCSSIQIKFPSAIKKVHAGVLQNSVKRFFSYTQIFHNDIRNTCLVAYYGVLSMEIKISHYDYKNF